MQGLLPDPASSEMLRHTDATEINPAKSHFIIIGDTQKTSLWEFWRERNNKERKLIIDEISRGEPAFVVHLGDLTAFGSSKRHWEDFDEMSKGLREKKIPLFPIFGNHDVYGNKNKAVQFYFDRFPHLEGRRWYGFRWKNLGLMMVDSNFSTLTAGQSEEQSRWYLGELGRFEEDERLDYAIVCCHNPPFTNSRVVHPNKKAKECFADPFLCYSKTALFCSGHTHSYERFQMNGKSFVVSGGGGGPRHKVFTNPAKRRFEDLFVGPELRLFHFIVVEIKDNALASNVFGLHPDGTFTIVDSFKVIKKFTRTTKES